MSRLGINTGSNPNDGQGDPLRVAMGKINSNFLELYNTFGDGFTITSYASTSGISTLARNLTGSPRINVSGILNTGITTTEHIEVRNIKSTGVVTATQFVGDGSQLTNVTSTASGVSIYDDNVFLGVARELDFDANIVSTSPDGTQRVRISAQGITSLSQLNISGVSTFAGIATHTASLFGTQARFSGVVTATSFVGDGSQLTGISGIVGSAGTWAVTTAGIHTTKNVGIGTTAKSSRILDVNGLPDKTVSVAATSIIGYGPSNSIRLSSSGFLFPDFYTSVGNDLGLEIPLGVGDFEVNSVLAKFRQTLQVGTIGVGQSACVFIDARGYMGQGGGQGGPWIGVGAGVSINGSAGGNIQIGVTTGGTGVNIRGNTGSINATGIITAASFVGDGSALTNVPVSGIATVAQGLVGTPNISVNQVGISSYLTVTGVTTFFNNVHFDYDRYVLIGSNDELQLFHNGSNSYIENTSTNNLIVRSTGGSIVFQKVGPENMGVFNTDGSVELYFDNSKKFETTGYGVTIFGGLNSSGVVTATRFESASSGTPTIGAATTVNIDTIKVAISTDLTVGRNLNVSGVVTSTGGFISVGNTTPIQISLVGNQLTFTAVGIGSTTLTLF